MYLHLLRHAHAGDPEAWTGDDAARPLSDKGRRQSKRLGRALAGFAFTPDLLITSPKLRAVETAEIVAELLDASVAVDDRLAKSLDLSTVDAVLSDHGDPERPVLVGHDPDLSELVAVLCAAGIPMRKGAFARIDVDRPLEPGAGTLRWLVPPNLLKTERPPEL
jgi:phosphohistidine phosphatase